MRHQKLRLATISFSLLLAVLGCVARPVPSPHTSLPIVEFSSEPFRYPAESLAFAIHVRDVAAWRATDRLLETGFDLATESISGWIVVGTGSLLRVRFIREGSNSPSSVVDVDVDVSSLNRGQVTSYANGASLSVREQAMWRARQSAASSGFVGCGGQYNSVVLPQPGSNNWLVYLLSASAKGEIVVGRHFRVVVDPNGNDVMELKPLSNGCLRFPPDEDAVGFVFTQIVAEEPLETSVLLSLEHPKKIMFQVPSGSTWVAENGRLSLIRNGPAD